MFTCNKLNIIKITILIFIHLYPSASIIHSSEAHLLLVERKIFTDEEKSVMSATVADFGYDIPKIIMADSRGISPSLSFLDEFVRTQNKPERMVPTFQF